MKTLELWKGWRVPKTSEILKKVWIYMSCADTSWLCAMCQAMTSQSWWLDILEVCQEFIKIFRTIFRDLPLAHWHDVSRNDYYYLSQVSARYISQHLNMTTSWIFLLLFHHNLQNSSRSWRFSQSEQVLLSLFYQKTNSPCIRPMIFKQAFILKSHLSFQILDFVR